MARDLQTLVGQMRHRLVVKANTSTQETTYGSWTLSAATDSTRWGSIDPITAREKITAGQLVGEATHVVRMRFNTALVAAATLLYGSRTFEVQGKPINVNERDKVLEFMVKELT